ncbi:MAG: hypothetical protein ACJARR_001542 [Pseudophaeobacter arcticus]|jgi:hypothetical protein
MTPTNRRFQHCTFARVDIGCIAENGQIGLIVLKNSFDPCRQAMGQNFVLPEVGFAS